MPSTSSLRTNAGRFRVAGLAAALVLASVAALAFADMPLESVVPGQRGFSLTAGPGNRLERFDIEVLGLQFDVGLGFPLVLVRASGPFIDASGGVAAGMSGSPVYIPFSGRNELLGAIAYVFPESDHQLALVTPIGPMRDTLAFDIAGTTPTVFSERHGPAAPVATPILLSGLSERASALLDPLFDPRTTRLIPVQLGGVPAIEEENYQLEPGSAVSVQLVRGDVSISVIGTVTYFEGDRVLAFGHPLFGRGQVSFPLATAFVSHIVPSRVVPFKLANSGSRQLGVITQDRPAAISGRLAQAADMLPVTVTIQSLAGSVEKRFEVARDDRFHPALLAAATLQAVDETLGKVSAGTGELAWQITLGDGDTVNVLEQVVDQRDVARAVAQLAAEPLAILATNIYESPDLARVSLNVTVADELRVAEIVEVVLERTEVEPGDSAVAFMRLQPFRQEAVVETLRFSLPEGYEGDLRLLFRGGEVKREGLEDVDDTDDGLPPILSYGELLARLRSNVQASELIVETVVDGRIRRLGRFEFPYVIEGSERVSVTVVTEPEIPAEVGNDQP